MSTRAEKRQIKKAATAEVNRIYKLIAEIKGLNFKIRLSIAWAILKGEKR